MIHLLAQIARPSVVNFLLNGATGSDLMKLPWDAPRMNLYLNVQGFLIG
jgi:hypothetical protein